jgi:transcriptional regulator with PAS, ATPase and Fis domain
MIAIDKLQDIKNRFEIVGNAAMLNRALEVAVKVAPTDMNVLILGESGVGKENISKIIHHMSRRKHNGFIAINCGAIPAGTIDSELFGHEKGSFTSAHEARKGYFETVDGGTIFLDEIGELPLETQSRLLRVLESGEFFKVGSSKVQKTDVRVIAATNKDLLELTQKAKFREDLYYRLSTVTIKIPPLRERANDIEMLFIKFASDIADKYKVPPVELTPDALALVKSFGWPGNIRQLKNFVEQISILETDRLLNASAIEKYLPELPSSVTSLTMNEDRNGSAFGGYQEREIMYKFLFDIKRDIGDLRNSIYELVKNINKQGGGIQEAVNQGTRLLAPVGAEMPGTKVYTPEPAYPARVVPANDVIEDGYVIENHPAEEHYSLQDKEKEMIKKALSRHQGKRKTAAQELGISERTLYRKIKEYNLEE